MLLVTTLTFAQKPKRKLYTKIDDRNVFFGFSFGVNVMDFSSSIDNSNFANDSLYATISNVYPGFNVNIISSLKLHDNLHLRFLPGLSFGQRNVSFYDHNIYDDDIILESSFMEFPLLLKYSAKRMNNFKPYLITGATYRLDLAAKKEYNIDEDIIMRLNRSDFHVDLGVGLDFYLEWFKLSTELKYSFGLTNTIVTTPPVDKEQYVNALEALRSNVFTLSFHFE